MLVKIDSGSLKGVQFPCRGFFPSTLSNKDGAKQHGIKRSMQPVQGTVGEVDLDPGCGHENIPKCYISKPLLG
jgi:hypothetical protein